MIRIVVIAGSAVLGAAAASGVIVVACPAVLCTGSVSPCLRVQCRARRAGSPCLRGGDARVLRKLAVLTGCLRAVSPWSCASYCC
jgi:hypothetical protein